MPIDRDTQPRAFASSTHRAASALAFMLASCAFDPSTWGNPQISEDLVSDEPGDAGIDDASARAGIGDGQRAQTARDGGPRQDDSSARRASAARDRAEIAHTPISAGAAAGAGSASYDEDAGEDDAGGVLADASMTSSDAEVPIVDGSVLLDASPVDGSSQRDAGRPSSEDRRFALDMLEVVVDILQGNPDEDPGDLLGTLAGDVTPDAELVTDFLEFVSTAEDCDDRREPCADACTVVAARCDICTRDAECSEVLNEACGRDNRCW